MADKLVPFNSFGDQQKYVDNGDGSYSMGVQSYTKDGENVTFGAKADEPVTAAATAAPVSLMGLLKGIWNKLFGTLTVQVSESKAQEYESLTIDNTAGGIALTAAKYSTCTKAFITVETAQIRWTIDGTAPTTTVGHLANAYDIIDLTSAEDLAAFRAIRVGSVSGTIHCTYSI